MLYSQLACLAAQFFVVAVTREYASEHESFENFVHGCSYSGKSAQVLLE